MNRSPLQLKHYFFTRIEIEPVEEYRAPDGQEIYPNVRGEDLYCDFAYAEPDTGKDYPFHGVRLSVSLNKDKKPSLPYRAIVGLEGVFEVVNEWPQEKRFDLVAINGSSILYSVARDVLLSQTLRFASGPILLPTVTFQDFRNLRQVPSSEQPAPSPAVATETARTGALSAPNERRTKKQLTRKG